MAKSDRYHKTFPVTWEQLHRDAKALSWRLLERGKFTKIVAVTRGGLIPAGIIARELNIRHIDTACIMLYNYREEGDQETVLKSADPSFNTEETLVIDDLVDTGHTARILRDMLPSCTPSLRAFLWWTASLPSSARTPGCSSPGIPKCSTPSPSSTFRTVSDAPFLIHP